MPESPEGAGGAVTATPAVETITPWVIPTYNEAENLERIVGDVLGQLPSSRRILIVDDNSSDGTGAIADRLAASDDSVAVLHRPRKQGLGPAYLAAFRVALDQGADRIIEMDADFSHDPAYLPELIEATEHADLAIGSRYVARRRHQRVGADA